MYSSRCINKTVCGLVCKNKRCNGLKVCNIHARDCSVCLEKTTEGEVCTLVCGHSYHTCCIYPWFAHDHRCPMCRVSVRRPKIAVSIDSSIIISPQITNDIRDMLNQLYDDGTLPSGHIHITNRDNNLAVIDLNN